MSAKNPRSNYAIEWILKRRGLSETEVTAAIAAITVTSGEATGSVFGDVVGSLLGPLLVKGIHGDEIAPPALAADVDSYAPAGGEDALIWNVDFATFAIDGIPVPDELGRLLILRAVSAGTLHHDNAAIPEEGVLCPGDVNLDVDIDTAIWLAYLGTPSRWQVIGGAGGGGGAPSGPAGGDLGGTFPNPSVNDNSHSHSHDTTITDVSADDHHAQSHGHTGGDGSGTVAHGNLTGVTANQHHNQLHHAEHEPGGGDAMAVDAAQATGSLRTLSAAAPTSSAPGDAAAAGAGTAAAPYTHRHAREGWGLVGDITTENYGDAPAAGASGRTADAGHRHGMPAATTPVESMYLYIAHQVK